MTVVSLFYYTLILTIAVLALGAIQYGKFRRKFALVGAVLIALALEAGTRMFLIDNLGKSPSPMFPGSAFDFTGLHIVGAGAVGVLVWAGAMGFRQKKFMPWGLLGVMGAAQVVIYLLMLSNYNVSR